MSERSVRGRTAARRGFVGNADSGTDPAATPVISGGVAPPAAIRGDKRAAVAHAPPLLLTRQQYDALRFALDLVHALGAEHGFDPSELTRPTTGKPFGPFIARMQAALRLFEALSKICEDAADFQGAAVSHDPGRGARG